MAVGIHSVAKKVVFNSMNWRGHFEPQFPDDSFKLEYTKRFDLQSVTTKPAMLAQIYNKTCK